MELPAEALASAHSGMLVEQVQCAQRHAGCPGSLLLTMFNKK